MSVDIFGFKLGTVLHLLGRPDNDAIFVDIPLGNAVMTDDNLYVRESELPKVLKRLRETSHGRA